VAEKKDGLKGMIDVSAKKETKRTAAARAFVRLNARLLKLIKEKKVFKGDVLEQARLAGIMAAKRTSDIIPLCHPLRLASVKISFEFTPGGIEITCMAAALERTGVEMETLVGASVAALAVYDMCKMYDRAIEITDIYLLEKRGGKSGTYKRKS